MKLKERQIVLWWSNKTGWRTFAVQSVHSDKNTVVLINRKGDERTVNLDTYGHRIRTYGLKLLMPWLWPVHYRPSIGGGPLRWNAPKRKFTQTT